MHPTCLRGWSSILRTKLFVAYAMTVHLIITQISSISDILHFLMKWTYFVSFDIIGSLLTMKYTSISIYFRRMKMRWLGRTLGNTAIMMCTAQDFPIIVLLLKMKSSKTNGYHM